MGVGKRAMCAVAAMCASSERIRRVLCSRSPIRRHGGTSIPYPAQRVPCFEMVKPPAVLLYSSHALGPICSTALLSTIGLLSSIALTAERATSSCQALERAWASVTETPRRLFVNVLQRLCLTLTLKLLLQIYFFMILGHMHRPVYSSLPWA